MARQESARRESALDVILLFGGMGAITWAIRGTNGWGGVDGTIVPGMTWGLLWYYLCQRKGIDARGVPLWLGLGIALGGELGYGQYVSWIQGKFNVGEEIIPVSPWLGYLWFAICGVGWGGPGGIVLGWTLRGKTSVSRWIACVFIPIGAGLAGLLLVRACPAVFFPNYDLGFYTGELDRHLERTVHTNTQNFAVFAWWIGAMAVAAFQGDRVTLVAGAIVGGGFGIGFPVGALWCLGYSVAPQYIDWWKMWELTAGFNLGLLYAVMWFWATTRRLPEVTMADDTSPGKRGELRKDFSLTFAVFLLLFVSCFGATSRGGVLLGLYDPAAVDQYQWPEARVLLFLPMAATLAGGALLHLRKVLREARDGRRPSLGARPLAGRMTDLMTFLGVVGTVTIWPEKISALYALFLAIALHAHNRLERAFEG